MSKRAPRNIEKAKKKARRAAPRPPQTRIQGNTAGARKRLKRLAAKAMHAKTKAKTAASA